MGAYYPQTTDVIKKLPTDTFYFCLSRDFILEPFSGSHKNSEKIGSQKSKPKLDRKMLKKELNFEMFEIIESFPKSIIHLI